jgi:hypothetical protein
MRLLVNFFGKDKTERTMQRLLEAAGESQRVSSNIKTETELSSSDRRLLLGASLRLLGHRFICGKPILQDDVMRVASLADDVERAA